MGLVFQRGTSASRFLTANAAAISDEPVSVSAESPANSAEVAANMAELQMTPPQSASFIAAVNAAKTSQIESTGAEPELTHHETDSGVPNPTPG